MKRESLLEILAQTSSERGILGVLIGGMALPAYGTARSTLDVDFCIRVKTQDELDAFVSELARKGVRTVQRPMVEHDLFFVFGSHGVGEVWLTPCDTFRWDDQMATRTRVFYGNVRVLAPEDYVVSKLGRSDRSSVDVDDAIQVLVANAGSLDWKYLRFRSRWAGLERDLDEVLVVLKEAGVLKN
ncbi:MAG: hypothetical protein Kow0069_27580 [Promethearchaeota archaeon]